MKTFCEWPFSDETGKMLGRSGVLQSLEKDGKSVQRCRNRRSSVFVSLRQASEDLCLDRVKSVLSEQRVIQRCAYVGELARYTVHV